MKRLSTLAALLAITATSATAQQPLSPSEVREYCEAITDARSASQGAYGQTATSAVINGIAGMVGDAIRGNDPLYTLGRAGENAVRGTGNDWERARQQRDARERAVQACVKQHEARISR